VIGSDTLQQSYIIASGGCEDNGKTAFLLNMIRYDKMILQAVNT